MKETATLSGKEKKKLQKELEKRFQRYRIFQILLAFEGGLDGEEDSFLYKPEVQKKRREFCRLLDAAVNHLPEPEQEVIKKRYLANDADYITDIDFYTNTLQVSGVTYTKYRDRAFEKLALMLGV